MKRSVTCALAAVDASLNRRRRIGASADGIPASPLFALQTGGYCCCRSQPDWPERTRKSMNLHGSAWARSLLLAEPRENRADCLDGDVQLLVRGCARACGTPRVV